jgi:dienelactone hydrolase
METDFCQRTVTREACGLLRSGSAISNIRQLPLSANRGHSLHGSIQRLPYALYVSSGMAYDVQTKFRKSGRSHAESYLRLLEREDAEATLQAQCGLVNRLWCTGKVGVMGFCLGGLLTYLTAVRGGVDAGVCYYSGRTEEFLSESRGLSGPLLMHLGELDE